MSDPLAEDLRRYLQQSRDGLVRSLEGLSEHDVRRPLTPTGANLLGIIKHLVGVELGHLVESVGREAPVLPWYEDGSVWEGADMWARAGESREGVLRLYRTAWRLADASIATLPLDAPATVAWWPKERRAMPQRGPSTSHGCRPPPTSTARPRGRPDAGCESNRSDAGCSPT